MDIVDDLRKGPYEEEWQYKREARFELSGTLERAANEIEGLREDMREIYEVYAGSEGVPQPMTATEGYLLHLLMKTVKIASKALKGKE
jgi:hypothetical protein